MIVKALLQKWRHIAFASCNIFLLLIGCLVLSPIYSYFGERDAEIQNKQDTAVRLQSIVAREAEIREASQHPEQKTDGSEFLSGPSDSVIIADLQTRLKAVSERNGARVRTMQSQPARSSDSLHYVGAQISIFGNLSQIHRTIYEIEGNKPYLFITTATMKLSPASAQKGTAEEPVVEVKLDICGARPSVEATP